MGVYDRQIATAKRLIAAKGQSVIWRQLTDGNPADSDKPWNAGETRKKDHTVSIVFLPDTRSGYEMLRAMGVTEVPKGNMIGLMAQVPFTPALKDIVLRDGVPVAIRTITPLAPNGENILYTVGFDV